MRRSVYSTQCRSFSASNVGELNNSANYRVEFQLLSRLEILQHRVLW